MRSRLLFLHILSAHETNVTTVCQVIHQARALRKKRKQVKALAQDALTSPAICPFGCSANHILPSVDLGRVYLDNKFKYCFQGRVNLFCVRNK